MIVKIFFTKAITNYLLHIISKKLTQKFFTMSSGKPFILRWKIKGQVQESITVPAWVFALLWVLVSFGFRFIKLLIASSEQ